jgi:uncharacterized membrane protein
MRRACLWLSSPLLGIATAAAAAAAGDVIVIPLPQQTFSFANDVNNRGVVVGIHSSGPAIQAFVSNRKSAELFSFPGSSFTSATGLNDAGDVVGIYAREEGIHGFFRARKGTLATIDVPGAVETWPEDVNKRHQVVGHFTQLLPNTDPWIRGFLLDAGGVRILDNPLGGFNTLPQAMNDAGTIAGWLGGSEGDDPRHGFILRDAQWTAVSYPGANQTYVTGIASDDAVVGYAVFFDRNPPEVGFVYRDGAFEDLAPEFQPYGINASGRIVGVHAAPLARAAVTCAPPRAHRRCK